MYADPATGTVEANSTVSTAPPAQTTPATTNASETAGPAFSLATLPVRTKMPVPMMTPTPKTVRSKHDSNFFSACSSSSVSKIDCSTSSS